MKNQILKSKKENIWWKKRITNWPIVLSITSIIILVVIGTSINALDDLDNIFHKKDNPSQEGQIIKEQIQEQETKQEQIERFEQDKEAIRSFYQEIVVYDTKVVNYYTTTREKISKSTLVGYQLYQAFINAKENMDLYSRGIEAIEIPDIHNKDDEKKLKQARSSLTLTYMSRSNYFGSYAEALDEKTNAGIQKKKNLAIAFEQQAHQLEMEAIKNLVEVLDKYDLSDEYLANE